MRIGKVNMDEISEATKRAVRAAIKEARSHLKNCEMIMKGWVPNDSWPTRAKWMLSEELMKLSKVIYEMHDVVLKEPSEAPAAVFRIDPETKDATSHSVED